MVLPSQPLTIARGCPTQLILSAVYLQPTMLELVPGNELLRLDAEALDAAADWVPQLWRD